jgi:hypothetical protein
MLGATEQPRSIALGLIQQNRPIADSCPVKYLCARLIPLGGAGNANQHRTVRSLSAVGGAVTAVVALIIGFPTHVKAQQPPRNGCVTVSKIEYDSAKKQYFLMSSNVGVYVRTGRFLRRSYWYCH